MDKAFTKYEARRWSRPAVAPAPAQHQVPTTTVSPTPSGERAISPVLRQAQPVRPAASPPRPVETGELT
ncbi:hypothetical protein JCM9957A_55320 [Kineosporia succinea]